MTKDIKAQVADAKKSFTEFSKEVSNGIEKAILDAALKVERDAKNNCAVDTGRLRSSITHRLGEDDKQSYAEVGTSVDYGLFIEFGTSKMKAQPFLTPAYESNKEAIKDYIARAVKKAAEDAGR